MSSENYQMLAKTFEGLEDVLKAELEAIGAVNVEKELRGVKFSGSKEVLYKANFCCRTAIKVLRIIGHFKIINSSELYHTIYHLDWRDYIDVSQSFAIFSIVDNEAFNNSTLINLRTKDAIIDHFKAKSRKRPTVNTDNPDIILHAHATSDSLTLYMDSSGEALNKRGYRVGQSDSSMNEVLAAGILKLAGWNGKCDLYDTMCGSGTIPVEAALMARNIPPGIFRKEFAFEKWNDFDADLFEEVYNEDYEVPFEHKIYASDIVPVNIRVSEKNAKNAGVSKEIEFSVADFAKVVPNNEKGILLVNPPADERGRERNVDPAYVIIGDQIRRAFSGFRTWVFSNSEQGFRSIGLRPGNEFQVFNGGSEYFLRLFEMYSDDRKSNEVLDKSFAKPRAEFSGKRRSVPMGESRVARRSSSSFKGKQNPDFDRKRSADSSRNFNRNVDDAEERRSKFHAQRRNSLLEKKMDKSKNDSGLDDASHDLPTDNGKSTRTSKRPRTNQ